MNSFTSWIGGTSVKNYSNDWLFRQFTPTCIDTVTPIKQREEIKQKDILQRQINHQLQNQNKSLSWTHTFSYLSNSVQEQFDIPVKLTTWTACHSFATKLKNSKTISLSFIMESLGHSSINTTLVTWRDLRMTAFRKTTRCWLRCWSRGAQLLVVLAITH